MSKIEEEELLFTPETLGILAKRVEDFRMGILFNLEGAGAGAFAEQHYLAALAHLELAQREFKLAQLHQTRAIA